MGRIEEIPRCYELADRLRERKDAILELLTDYESHEAAVDEWERAIHCLDNIYLELSWIRAAHVQRVVSFLPVNLPLYSLVLFGVIPSLYADQVFVRSPSTITEWTQRIFDLVGLRDFFPRVGLYDVSRSDFRSHFAARSDVILFTGTTHASCEMRAPARCSSTTARGSTPSSSAPERIWPAA